MRLLLAILAAVALGLLIVIAVQMDGLAPLRDQPFRLTSSSDLSGSVSIKLETENNMTLTNKPLNKNGVEMTITTRVQDYATADEAWAAHFAAIKRWQDDDTIQK